MWVILCTILHSNTNLWSEYIPLWACDLIMRGCSYSFWKCKCYIHRRDFLRAIVSFYWNNQLAGTSKNDKTGLSLQEIPEIPCRVFTTLGRKYWGRPSQYLQISTNFVPITHRNNRPTVDKELTSPCWIWSCAHHVLLANTPKKLIARNCDPL